ncbi:MAG: Zn-ribbon domain-containing OB-fold protein [Candidatus Bipolaricaulia bacterium]
MERISKPTGIKHWLGHMEVDHYYYTAGLAGERFFTALRDEGKLLSSRCSRCEITYIPPRIYCERCFAELKDFVDVGLRGRVRSFTIARIDREGRPLEEPEIRALISFGDETTALLHLLGEVEPDELCIGMEVEAVLKPKREREGKITDILYFRPVK